MRWIVYSITETGVALIGISFPCIIRERGNHVQFIIGSEQQWINAVSPHKSSNLYAGRRMRRQLNTCTRRRKGYYWLTQSIQAVCSSLVDCWNGTSLHLHPFRLPGILFLRGSVSESQSRCYFQLLEPELRARV